MVKEFGAAFTEGEREGGDNVLLVCKNLHFLGMHFLYRIASVKQIS